MKLKHCIPDPEETHKFSFHLYIITYSSLPWQKLTQKFATLPKQYALISECAFISDMHLITQKYSTEDWFALTLISDMCL